MEGRDRGNHLCHVRHLMLRWILRSGAIKDELNGMCHLEATVTWSGRGLGELGMGGNGWKGKWAKGNG